MSVATEFVKDAMNASNEPGLRIALSRALFASQAQTAAALVRLIESGSADTREMGFLVADMERVNAELVAVGAIPAQHFGIERSDEIGA